MNLVLYLVATFCDILVDKTATLAAASDGFNVRGAWSEISRGAAVKHFVVAALW